MDRINTTPISLKSFYRKIEVDLVSSKNTGSELGWTPKLFKASQMSFCCTTKCPLSLTKGRLWFGLDSAHIIHLQMSPRSQMGINYATTNSPCFKHDMAYLAYQNVIILSMFKTIVYRRSNVGFFFSVNEDQCRISRPVTEKKKISRS